MRQNVMPTVLSAKRAIVRKLREYLQMGRRYVKLFIYAHTEDAYTI